MWWVYALLSAFFAAVTAILAKIGVRDINSNLATAIRTVVILLMAWGIVLARGEYSNPARLPSRTLIFLVLSGIATGLSWIFYFKALQLGKASLVSPVDKSSLVMTIVLAAIFLQETLTWQVVTGALLITAGTLIIVWQR
ncbi:MAG TPA: EamA family transporter [Abditibacteriaceae bacterium]|jgi:transporter family protein